MYLHSKNIVHRDIKPENIMIEDKNAELILIKLVDFGLSTYIPPGEMLSKRLGTPSYMDPTIILKYNYN